MIAISIHPGAIASFLAFGLLFGVILWYWARKSEDPPGILIIKIILSTALLGAATWCIVSLHPMIGVPVGAICGIIIGILWGRNIGTAMARPLADLYDGGTEEPEQKPFYAIAEAHRKQARYAEAMAEIDKQLERFPGDVQGLLLLAEIRARHLGDWEGAAAAVESIVDQGALPVSTRARAIQALADWHLDLKQDGPGARALFSRIPELFPGTPEANEAEQRLAHLGDDAWRRERKAPSTFKVVATDQRLGLRRDAEVDGEAAGRTSTELDPQVEADTLIAHLGEHPKDTDARERLGLLYVERMGRLDWGLAEIETLLADAQHPPKSQARWLHLVADLQIRHAQDEGEARRALARVIERFPGTALEAKAKTRLEHLKLEMRGQEKAQTVRRRLG